MKVLYLILSSVLIITPAKAQSQTPVDSFLVADWHFDESSGTMLIDSAAYDNHGYSNGTMAVTGVKGYAQNFNGFGSYISVSSPRLLDFAPSQSFRIDFSFKTDSSNGTILQKGTPPAMGYMVSIRYGLLRGVVGSREDSQSPDSVAVITSAQRVDDNRWHRASFIRTDNRSNCCSTSTDRKLLFP